MHRFFIDPARPDRIEGAENNHLTRVLRLREGERVELLDGKKIFLAEITVVGKDATAVKILSELPSREPKMNVTLYIGQLKGEKMDWVAQKAAELGARALYPVNMRRSVAKGGNTERLCRIAKEAQKQCGRARGVTIGETMPFEDAICLMGAHQRLIVPYEGGGEDFRETAGSTDIGLLIGPEGGIAPEEIEALEGVGAKIVTLGPRILRAETAAVAALAAIMALGGEWI